MTDDIQIANKFNTFFTNIGLNLASNINIQSNKNYASYLNAQNNDFFTFQDVWGYRCARLIKIQKKALRIIN